MQWLNYHHLYYFYVIASEGSVTEATRKLKLAQSTLSAQLKQFEEFIGYRLFERKHRRLILTDVGLRVYDYAHEIFSLGTELKESLEDFEGALRVSIRLGIMDSIPKKISRDIFEFITDQHGARITVIEESLPTLTNRLENHEIDLILSNDKPPTEGKKSRFHAKLIGELRVIFVAPPHKAYLKSNLPRSLNNEPMIMPGLLSPLRSEIMEHLKIKHVHPKIVGEVDDLELQKMLVIDGHGFTALPIIAVEKEIEAGSLVRLSEMPICHENLWLISGHRLVHNPIAKLLLDTFRLAYKLMLPVVLHF